MIPVVPEPVSIRIGAGAFHGSSACAVVCPERSAAIHAARRLATEFGLIFDNGNRPNDVSRIVYEQSTITEPEGYELLIEPGSVVVRAQEARGFLHATQTLRQLNPDHLPGEQWEWPTLRVYDYPRFSWRGMHLDVSRHYFSVDFIKRYLELMALHKLNTFHWHLTDDQGWRLEIRRYRELTQRGAWRVDRSGIPWNDRKPQLPGESADYGGFYTQDEVRGIVAHAESLGIEVVPEIEMPAHSLAALACFGDLSCRGGPFHVATGQYWPETDLYCAGNDATFEFLENVLREVCELFPGRFVHIGGDEAEPEVWQECPRCRARMEELRLATVGELQHWFMARIARFLESLGKRAIGWDEMLDDSLPQTAAIMSWRGTEAGLAAAKAGRNVVMCPVTHCYFDHYQLNPASQPTAFGGFTPLQKVYEFEPVPGGLCAENARHILGAQGNLWTEYIPTPAHAEYMALPRMAALSEVVWSPRAQRNWSGFSRRMTSLARIYRRLDLNYAPEAIESAPD